VYINWERPWRSRGRIVRYAKLYKCHKDLSKKFKIARWLRNPSKLSPPKEEFSTVRATLRYKPGLRLAREKPKII
jgi:hypothetical protein